MYYLPFMLDWASNERTLATCKAFVDVCVDGIARQQQAHADAVNTFYGKQLENLRMLSEATDTTQFAAQLLSCAVPEPLGLAELSARLREIAKDTHRKLGELAGSHADEVTRSFVEPSANVQRPPRKPANGSRAIARRQMMA